MIMKKFYKKFTTKKEMVQSIAGLTKGLDVDKMVERLHSAGPRRLYVIDKKGSEIACDNFKKFIAVINQQEGLSLLHQISFGRGEVYHVYSVEDYFNTEEKQEEATVEPATPVECPLEKYKLLEYPDDITGSKKALHNAAKKDLGLDIKKNQKFESMLAEIASHLEK